MKTIIIPDLHTHVEWVEEFIDEQKADEVVFLGDYFDDFYDTPEIAENTAKWLKQSIAKSNRIHLMGNHDLPYAYPQSVGIYCCSGYSHEKMLAIRSVLSKEDFDKVKLFRNTNDFFMSHAGLHPYFFGEFPKMQDIQRKCDKALESAVIGLNHDPLLLAGRARYGRGEIGGVIWADWDEFKHINNLNQIVGHTPNNFVRSLILPGSRNYCIDTFSQFYMEIIDGKEEIKITPKYGRVKAYG